MMFIIDGTGDDNDELYAKDMDRGFCKQLSLKLGSNAKYLRGPAQYGTETFKIADEMIEAILKYYYSEPIDVTVNNSKQVDINQIIADALKPKTAKPIFLAGHSRGGCAVIYIAQKLKEKGINVKAMFLFDAVERTVALLTKGEDLLGSQFDEIPDNVGKCYHARRDRSIATYYEDSESKLKLDCLMETHGAIRTTGPTLELARNSDSCRRMRILIIQNRKLGYDIENEKMKVVMRTHTGYFAGEKALDFENCGTGPKSRVETKYFLGSHGALGGAPIATSPIVSERERAPKEMANSDRAAVADVNVWMSEKLCNEGVLASGLIIS